MKPRNRRWNAGHPERHQPVDVSRVVEQSRREQGLPPRITNPDVVARLAAIFERSNQEEIDRA